jgi:hypothetical protein
VSETDATAARGSRRNGPRDERKGSRCAWSRRIALGIAVMHDGIDVDDAKLREVTGMEDKQPLDEDGQPRDAEDYDRHDGDDVEPRDSNGSDALEAEIMQADHAFGMGLWGTTAKEELAGEGLDRALAQERPDVPRTDEALEVVDEEERVDREAELIGDAVLTRDEFAPPEEAAVTVDDEVPGGTDHSDLHPDQDVDEDVDD